MALSNREQKIMILVVAAIVVLLGDKYVLRSLFEKKAETSDLKITLATQLKESQDLLKSYKVQKVRWDNMLESGLYYDVQQTEQDVLRFIKDASNRSYFSLTSIQPEHPAQKDKFGRVDFLVAGTGTMQSVATFLWNIETATEVPIKVESMQLGANNENAEVMSLQLNLSSIYMIKDSEQEAK